VRAVRSLLATNTSLAEAAVDAGFADQAHLTRVFRSIMGATPGQYRAALAT
jgi:AraC-like DNA-binding protein